MENILFYPTNLYTFHLLVLYTDLIAGLHLLRAFHLIIFEDNKSLKDTSKYYDTIESILLTGEGSDDIP